jgi:lysophospholipase L1-like esterase
MFGNRWFYGFGLLILALLGWTFYRQAAPPITNAPPKPGAIVAFGDSLTAGQGASAAESYPEVLSTMIGQPILNAGHSGDTIADAEARLEGAVFAANPSIVIVLLGGNDLLQHNDLDQAFAGLERIVRAIQARGAVVILVGLDDWPLLGHGLASRYRDLAQRTGSLYIANILKGIFGHRSLMSDQVHPNGEGYRLMAQRIAKPLKTLLARTQ